MTLNEILNNETMKKDFDRRVELTYKSYKLYNIMELEEFYQEACIYVLRGVESFDSSRATLGTYLTTLIQHCGKRMIRNAVGQSEGLNKLEFHNNMTRLDYVASSIGEDNYYNFIGDTSQNIEDDYIYKDTLKYIVENNLTDFQKEILSLRLEGKFQSEIAEILKTSQVSISRQLKKIKLEFLNTLEIAR